jgi:dipeptidyl aminopeptidase/acylaminoacyl peptidase
VHLFVAEPDTGKCVQLTEGPIEVRSAQWCPQSHRIAFSRTREVRLAHRTDLWIIDADGQHQRQLTQDVALVSNPKWDSEGERIVFTGARDDGDAEMRLWLYEFARDSARPLGSEDIEVVDVDSVGWSANNGRVNFIGARYGRQEIASVGCGPGDYRTHVGGDRQISAMCMAGEQYLFVSEDATEPCEVYASSLDGRNERRLTDLNGWWRQRSLPEAKMRAFDVPAADDENSNRRETVEGWVLRPRGASGPTPLLVDVHGGPASYRCCRSTGTCTGKYWSAVAGRSLH